MKHPAVCKEKPREFGEASKPANSKIFKEAFLWQSRKKSESD
jgi:hypothetical protein